MKSVLLTSWIFYSAVGFFSGAVMYSYWIPKVFCKIDIRKTAADHNPGGMNAIHAAGMGIGLLCIVLDVLKAFIPVLLAVKVGGIREIQLIPVTAAPVLGHVFSPFLKFRGGKGISSLFGALLGLWSLSKIVLLLLVFCRSI
jgi:glycerol-3-phosphate acyltransferase PlsY